MKTSKVKGRYVWFADGRADLLLDSCTLDENGNAIKGYVINGDWDFEIRDGEVLAFSGRFVKTRRPVPEKVETFKVDESLKGKGYNTVLDTMQALYNSGELK